MEPSNPTPKQRFLNARNYDSPDGEDCLEKTVHSAKVFGFLGSYFSLYDIIGVTHPVGVMATLGKVAQYGAPAAGAGAVYASTSCVLGSMRGKDDFINHTIAGGLAGALLGHAAKSTKATAIFCFLGATCGGMLKFAANGGFYIFDDTKQLPKESFIGAYNFTFNPGRKEYTPPTEY